MPGYLIDEGGERTHVVIPVEEYERLKRATENLEEVRGHAAEIMDVINRGNNPSAGRDPLEGKATGTPSTTRVETSGIPPETTEEASSAGAFEEEPQGEGRMKGYGW